MFCLHLSSLKQPVPRNTGATDWRNCTVEVPKPAEFRHVDRLKRAQRCCQVFLLLDDMILVFTQSLGDSVFAVCFLFSIQYSQDIPSR